MRTFLKTHLYRKLGVLLSLALMAGCVQQPVVTGPANLETAREEIPGTVTATTSLETGASLLPTPTEQEGAQAETSPAQDEIGDAPSFLESGFASWYANRFQGRRTASGEHYDLHALTAAHRTLPMGSYVRVTAVKSARSVIVRINDRGPYARGRVIDLSYAAAAALDLPQAGLLIVRIERVGSQEAGS